MNIKKKSIIIPAFALLIGASLAGSITGTVAWYQYSTRVQTAYVGVSGGTSGNLQIRLAGGEWSTRLTKEAIQTYVSGSDYGAKVLPITSGDMDKDDALPANFYLNPIYGQDGAYATNWQKADKANYVVLPLQLRYVERDGDKEGGANDAKNIAKEVFLSDLLIQEDKANTANVKEDLSDAIRFHIDAFAEADRNTPANHTNRLISKNGGTTVTEGKLDLDGDGVLDYKYDSDKYGFGSDDTTDLIYGEGSQVSFTNKVADQTGQAYYDAEGGEHADANVYSLVVESGDEGDLDIVEASKKYNITESKSIGSTIESETEFLNVVVTIWVEGWQTFEDATSHKHISIWDSDDFIGSSFDVGFEFAVDPVE